MTDANVSAAGLRIMKLLVGNRPQAVSDLIRATGVTRTAVTEQLTELTDAGLVKRETLRLSVRGRPKHVYSATDAAMHLVCASSQRLATPAIWRAIRDLGGEQFVAKVRKQVSRELAEFYNRKITGETPQERLRRLIEVLTAEGAVIEMVGDGQQRIVFNRRSCPFVYLLDKQRSVCAIDRQMLSAIIGTIGPPHSLPFFRRALLHV